MAFREVFAKLLNEETDWSAPENKATAQAEADADDGQDPGKKLFWSTNHPRQLPACRSPAGEVPMPSLIIRLSRRPLVRHADLKLFFYIITEDPAPSHENENAVAEAQSELHDGRPSVRGAEGARQYGHRARVARMKLRSPRARRSLSTVSAPCPASPTIPCAWTIRCRCRSWSILRIPPAPLRRPSSSSEGGGSGPVGAVGGVPETSTWLMELIGFGFLSLFRRSVMSTASGLIPRPTKA